jgi:hypothetical protein
VSFTFERIRLRANPDYRAVPWNRLPPGAREKLPVEADSYGVLVPRDGSDLPLMAIDRDTALLFLSLQEAGPAPDFVFAASAQEADRVLRRLVFDRVLELHWADEFVSGPEAHAVLGIGADGKRGDLANLSIEALRYGAMLADLDAMTLSHKLYCYNRRPTTPGLRRRLPDGNSCFAFLGLAPGGAARDAVDRFWSTDAAAPGWHVFMRRLPARSRPGQPCKLYVGIAFEDLPQCLPDLATVLGRSEALQFKIGADLDGLLRPDKMVAYFPSREALLEATHGLSPIVAGRPVHAVPFTAEIAGSGALSWGADPANTWLGDRVSWRQWICERLAAALVMARGNGDGAAPWRFALDRLGLEGVDTDTFMPTGTWPEAA